jgi:hypothetical protein
MIPKLSSSAIALALTFSHPVNPAIGESDFAVVRAAPRDSGRERGYRRRLSAIRQRATRHR